MIIEHAEINGKFAGYICTIDKRKYAYSFIWACDYIVANAVYRTKKDALVELENHLKLIHKQLSDIFSTPKKIKGKKSEYDSEFLNAAKCFIGEHDLFPESIETNQWKEKLRSMLIEIEKGGKERDGRYERK